MGNEKKVTDLSRRDRYSLIFWAVTNLVTTPDSKEFGNMEDCSEEVRGADCWSQPLFVSLM